MVYEINCNFDLFFAEHKMYQKKKAEPRHDLETWEYPVLFICLFFLPIVPLLSSVIGSPTLIHPLFRCTINRLPVELN